MHILIVYGTNSSGTQEAAEIIRDALMQHSHQVVLRAAQDAEPEELLQFPLVLLGSCTWGRVEEGVWLDGQLQSDMHDFAERLQQKTLTNTRFAVFALGDARYTSFCTAADMLARVVEKVGGTRVGEALRIDGYFFDLPRHRARVRTWANALAVSI